jgi:hypothetical protein
MTDTAEILDTPRPNPLLEKLRKKIPGETFRLPSRALFYKNGELDPEVENGELVVYPMTTVDELMMRSPDMLLQGTAITEVLRRCVPQILKPGQLIASDVDFLLTALRKVSYGPILPINHKCSACDLPEKDYALPLMHFIGKSKEITAEQFEAMSVNIDDYVVKLRPCVFEEMIRILQRSGEDFDSVEKVSEWIDTSLSAIIRSVDGLTDRAMILEWLGKLPRNMKEELSHSVERINQWGLEFTYEITCDGCGAKDNIKSTLNPTGFFTLPSSPKTQ